LPNYVICESLDVRRRQEKEDDDAILSLIDGDGEGGVYSCDACWRLSGTAGWGPPSSTSMDLG
jgi:hypothetical protein